MRILASKLLPALIFSVLSISISIVSFSQHHADAKHEDSGKGHGDKKEKSLDIAEVIFGHVLDGHEFHFFDIGDKAVTIPLPVILYSPQRGFSMFSSSKFEHGHADYNGYKLLNAHSIEGLGLDSKKYFAGQIVPVTAEGAFDSAAKVYDFSLTRNAVQLIIALTLLVFIMLRIAKKYKNGIGVTSAPRGTQSLLEPVIIFIRDEVAKPNLGHKYEKYLPFLLTVFFFILINNIFGLIPGSANVTGNIAFTLVLGVISFVMIIISSNKHFWSHIFNPPGVPILVKFILVPVEVLGLFIKPFALIIRLFANMFAGHTIIICLISLIFIFGQIHPAIGFGASPISLAFTIFIYLIEVLVAFIQAFIFTMLTAVFIGQAIEGDHHEHQHDEAHHPKPATV